MTHHPHRRDLLRWGTAGALGTAGLTTLSGPAHAAPGNVLFHNGGGLGSDPDPWTVVLDSRLGGGDRPYAVTESTAVKRAGRQSLRMEVRYDDPDAGDNFHSEVVAMGDPAGKRGTTRWYGWSTYVPDGWQFVDREVITAQVKMGGAPKDPPQGNVTAFMVLQDDRWRFLVRWTDTSQPDGTDGYWQDLGVVRKGQWTDWVLQIKWSSEPDGFYNLWKYDESRKFSYTGRTCFADDRGMQFRVGCYSSGWKNLAELPPGEPDTRVLYQDEIRIGDSGATFADVTPR